MSSKADATLILDDTSFQSTILDSDKPAMVDFWGDGCAPCKVIAPIIDELAVEYAGRVNIAKVKVEDAPDTAASFGIRGVPSVVFIVEGQEKTRMMGAAPKRKFVETLDTLLGEDNEAQQDLLAYNAVRQAIFDDDLDKVRNIIGDFPQLLENQCENGQTLVGLAVLVNRTAILDWFLDAGAATNFCDLAALGLLKEMRDIAHADNSTVNRAGPNDFTPLQLAALMGQQASVDLLIELGADVNQPGAGQAAVAPIMLAVSSKNLDIISALVAAGADVNVSGPSGYTSLHGASRAGSKEIVSYLLSVGANSDARNDAGETALEAAKKQGQTEVVELLANAG